MNLDKYLPPKARQYLYGVVVVALSVLVFYKLLDPSAVPLWVNVAGTVLGIASTGTATLAVTKQRNDGTLP